MLIYGFFNNLASSGLSSTFFLSSKDNPFVPKLYSLLRSINSSTVHIYFAGLPATTTPSGTDLVTIEPAATR